MTIWGSFWFWLVLLSILGLAITFLVIQDNVPGSVPIWVWYVYGISLILLLIGFILFCVQSSRPRLVMVDKCGRPVPQTMPQMMVDKCGRPVPQTAPPSYPQPTYATTVPLQPVSNPEPAAMPLPLLLPQPPVEGGAFDAANIRL